MKFITSESIIQTGNEQKLIFSHFSQFELLSDGYIPSKMHHIYTPLNNYVEIKDIAGVKKSSNIKTKIQTDMNFQMENRYGNIATLDDLVDIIIFCQTPPQFLLKESNAQAPLKISPTNAVIKWTRSIAKKPFLKSSFFFSIES